MNSDLISIFGQNMLYSVPKRHSVYPYYNHITVNSTTELIQVAVAGFSNDELSVSVDNQTLIISGKQRGDSQTYVHKGISTKDFEKRFTMSPYSVVDRVSLKFGILNVWVKEVIPEDKKPKEFKIDSE